MLALARKNGTVQAKSISVTLIAEVLYEDLYAEDL